MPIIGQMISQCLHRQRGLADKLLKDIRPDQFARLAAPGGKPVDSNHPAFVYAHLGLYPARVLDFLGLDRTPLAAPPGFEIAKAGEPCRDDPASTIYPPMETITTHFFRAHDHLADILPTIDDAMFAKDLTDERARQFVPIVGTGVIFLCTSHYMNHLGQVSAWRRMMNLPAAFQ